MSLRLVHIFGHGWGGAFVVNQVMELRRRGHHVSVVAPEDGPFVETLRSAGISVDVIPFGGSKVRDIPRILRSIWRLRRLLLGLKPDVVHLHLIKAIVIGRVAARLAGIKVVVSELGGPLPLEILPLRWLDLATAWLDTRIVASSEVIARIYRRYPHTKSKVTVIYYGFDTHRFMRDEDGDAFRREFAIPAEVPVVGIVAHMYDNRQRRFDGVGLKGHEVLIDACVHVVRKIPRVVLLIVGDEIPKGSGYRQRLEARVAEHGLESHVVFAGHRTDVRSALAAMDVVAVPSLSENLGGAVEPLLMRRPVVASCVGGLPEVVVDGVTGRLVRPRDANALAEAVTELLLISRQERDEMGERGRALVHGKFDLPATVKALEGVYIDEIKGVHGGKGVVTSRL